MSKWMHWIIGYYAVSFVIVVILIVLSVLFWDKRYKNRKTNEIPRGFIKTDEVSIDPATSERRRVYYNPETGERIYILE